MPAQSSIPMPAMSQSDEHSQVQVPSPVRAGVVLRPLPESDYAAWEDAAVEDYAAEKVRAGQWSAEESLERARTDHQMLLPRGVSTPDQQVMVICDATGARVGTLWFAVQPLGRDLQAYVFHIWVDVEHRRRGYAAAALRALEAEAWRRGWAGVALHVFAHNHGARALYAGLGYEPRSLNLFKPLPR